MEELKVFCVSMIKHLEEDNDLEENDQLAWYSKALEKVVEKIEEIEKKNDNLETV